jgi:hypothetical protein
MELPKMIHLALQYAVADEDKGPRMFAPDLGEIINRAARMLCELECESGRA